MRIIIVLIIAVNFSVSSVVYAGRDISLPFIENFNNASWINDLARTECGGQTTAVTSSCYEGGCMKVTPPTSACTGGGTNGGATGIDWVTYQGTYRIHVQFMIYFGPRFATSVADGGGGLINKFLLQQSPSRTGILGLNATDLSGRYLAWGVLDVNGLYKYKSAPSLGRLQDATFRISDSQHSQEWMCVEYWIDTSSRRTGLYVWTRNGLQEQITADAMVSNIAQQGFYISYYNCYGIQHPDNYYLIDNLRVGNNYIGPPAGFIGDRASPAPPVGLTIQVPN